VGFAARWLKVHYNIALVLAGAALSASRLAPEIRLDPEVVLQVFLPILLFQAAIETDVRRLRENQLPVVLLAVPGLLATVGVAGAVVHFGLGLPWPTALLLGSILATTDTIAVIASFRKVRAPGRLTTIVETESLFNDGTALVAFTAIAAWVQRGRFDPAAGLAELGWVTLAGLGIGVAAGYAASIFMRRTDDHLMEIMLTVAVTYGASVAAEAARASPILAVVAAGITVGTEGWKGIGATGKVAIRSFWEAGAFGVNSVVFLIIGMQVEMAALIGAAGAVAWGLLALTLGRVAAVYPFLWPLRYRGQPVPLSWQHVLVWGNLKGSLGMALVLSLPAGLPDRELLTQIVFGCALVTLTAQGLTLARFARALGLGRAGVAERRLEVEQGRLLAARAGQAELDRLQRMGLLPLGLFQRLRASYQVVIARSERELRDLLFLHSGEEARHIQALRRRLLAVEKSVLRDAGSAGILSEEVAAELAAEIDRALTDAETGERSET
jgi:CPA1 family monovalent cation:H+ antiporter